MEIAVKCSLTYLYRQSSGFPHHERKESDVFLLFLRNNVENHFLFAINVNGSEKTFRLLHDFGYYRVFETQISIGELDFNNAVSLNNDSSLLYARLKTVNNDGRYPVPDGALGDGRKLTPGENTGIKDITLDRTYLVDKILVYGSAPYNLQCKLPETGEKITLYNTKITDGLTSFQYTRSFHTKEILITGVDETTAELEIAGRPENDGKPYIKILYPFESEYLMKENTERQYVADITDSPNGHLTVNGIKPDILENIFYISFKDLNLDRNGFEEVEIVSCVDMANRGYAEEGPNPITLYAIDGSGNRSGDMDFTVNVDTTPPEPFASIKEKNGWTNDTTPRIHFATTDTGIGMDHYEIRIDGNAPFKAHSPCDLPEMPEGEHNITVIAYDKLGWTTTSHTEILIDSITPPAPLLLKASAGNDKITLTELLIEMQN